MKPRTSFLRSRVRGRTSTLRSTAWRVALQALLVGLVFSSSVAAQAPTPLPPAQAVWYEPSQLDPKLPDVAPPKPGNVYTVGLSYQLHGFVSGRPQGVGQSIDVSVGNRNAALTLGTFIPSSRISIGVDLGRNWGFTLWQQKKLSLAYMLPTLEARVYLRLDFLTTPVIELGSSTGLRLMMGRFGYDLRPRVDVWGDPNSRGSVAFSVGGSLAALMVF
jgi:hypothetical protein